MQFPDRFLWGSATAALQIEGAASSYGRGPSIWDAFCRDFPERIYQQATPEVACDHYHRYREDVEQIAKLGHNAYRFSISWPRLLPEGKGRINEEGVNFYHRLLDALKAHGITTVATLYHWDLPLALGSWESAETVEAFADFARLCFARFGDRVDHWCTLNEPGWSTLNGYITALHPPARHDPKAAVLVSHHLMMAHRNACRDYQGKGQVGIALNLSPTIAASPKAEDVRAAIRADGVLNRWFLEAAVHGRYPEEVLSLYEALGYLPRGYDCLPPAKLDFLGANYYYPNYVVDAPPANDFHLNNSGDKGEACRFSLAGCFAFVTNPNGQFTDWHWEIDPDALERLLLDLSRRFPGLPILVTENGIGLPDVLQNGEVDDRARIDFVDAHLRAIGRAIQAGADVRGYFMWSLMDNFSWVNGYKKRYGFLHVDRKTLERTAKKSAAWFASVAAKNGLEDD
jgi:6-phospho-beta-glucosidase